MVFRKWSNAQKAEAIALATSIGADLAGEQLGMSPDAIRDWAKRANINLADVISAPSWERLMNLALARTEAMVASGDLKPSQMATVAAIAKRNIDREPAAVAPSVAARGAFWEWMVGLLASDDRETVLDTDDDIDELVGRLQRALVVRANAEPERTHRRAILAWFSKRPEIEAGDILEWAQKQVREMLATHGTLTAWRDAQRSRDERQRVIRDRAEVLISAGMRYHEAYPFAAEISDDFPEVAA